MADGDIKFDSFYTPLDRPLCLPALDVMAAVKSLVFSLNSTSYFVISKITTSCSFNYFLLTPERGFIMKRKAEVPSTLLIKKRAKQNSLLFVDKSFCDVPNFTYLPIINRHSVSSKAEFPFNRIFKSRPIRPGREHQMQLYYVETYTRIMDSSLRNSFCQQSKQRKAIICQIRVCGLV